MQRLRELLGSGFRFTRGDSPIARRTRSRTRTRTDLEDDLLAEEDSFSPMQSSSGVRTPSTPAPSTPSSIQGNRATRIRKINNNILQFEQRVAEIDQQLSDITERGGANTIQQLEEMERLEMLQTHWRDQIRAAQDELNASEMGYVPAANTSQISRISPPSDASTAFGSGFSASPAAQSAHSPLNVRRALEGEFASPSTINAFNTTNSSNASIASVKGAVNAADARAKAREIMARHSNQHHDMLLRSYNSSISSDARWNSTIHSVDEKVDSSYYDIERRGMGAASNAMSSVMDGRRTIQVRPQDSRMQISEPVLRPISPHDFPHEIKQDGSVGRDIVQRVTGMGLDIDPGTRASRASLHPENVQREAAGLPARPELQRGGGSGFLSSLASGVSGFAAGLGELVGPAILAQMLYSTVDSYLSKPIDRVGKIAGTLFNTDQYLRGTDTNFANYAYNSNRLVKGLDDAGAYLAGNNAQYQGRDGAGNTIQTVRDFNQIGTTVTPGVQESTQIAPTLTNQYNAGAGGAYAPQPDQPSYEEGGGGGNTGNGETLEINISNSIGRATHKRYSQGKSKSKAKRVRFR